MTPTPSPSPTVAVVGFSSATYTAIEAGAPVTITISRTGDLDSDVAVSYRTSSTTASARDYTGANGTVVFSPGETAKTFTIQAFRDGDQQDETIDLTLSDLTGNAVFGHETAVLTVMDIDGVVH